MLIRLLRSARIAEEDQPVIGDLLEEYASGRSTLWLWRQAAALVATTVLDELRQHKLMALRAVGTGLLTILAASALKYRITSEPWANGLPAFWILTWLSFLLAGWVVGATHRHHGLPMLAAFTAYAAFAKGWLYVTHFHHHWDLAHPQRFAMDVAFTGVGLCLIVVGGLCARNLTEHVR